MLDGSGHGVVNANMSIALTHDIYLCFCMFEGAGSKFIYRQMAVTILKCALVSCFSYSFVATAWAFCCGRRGRRLVCGGVSYIDTRGWGEPCRRGVLVARQPVREEGGGFDSMFILSLVSLALTRILFTLNKFPSSDSLPYHSAVLP